MTAIIAACFECCGLAETEILRYLGDVKGCGWL